MNPTQRANKGRGSRGRVYLSGLKRVFYIIVSFGKLLYYKRENKIYI